MVSLDMLLDLSIGVDGFWVLFEWIRGRDQGALIATRSLGLDLQREQSQSRVITSVGSGTTCYRVPEMSPK
jgi:hypothetical protein